jgi:hypothetical protein
LLDILIKLATDVYPEGGSCPSLAIEDDIVQLESTNPEEYPLQTSILITDAVFDDIPQPVKAVAGLEAYKALRFAIGTALSNAQFPYGLTPEQAASQQHQLLDFVGGNSELSFNLDTQGWELLAQVAQDIAEFLPKYYYLGKPIPRYTWCGFRSLFMCSLDYFRHEHCEWPHSKVIEYGCIPVQGG